LIGLPFAGRVPRMSRHPAVAGRAIETGSLAVWNRS
jgi:hypothetical protein